MRILCDLDGVLADFTGGMCRAHGRSNPWTESESAGVYALDKLWGMTPAEFWRPADSEHFWAELEPTPEAFVLVRALEENVGAKNVAFLSSPNLALSCMAGKLRWIRQHFPDYSRRFLFGPRKEFCAGSPAHLLIDDHDSNVQDFRMAGGTAVLFPRPWNMLSGTERSLDHVLEAVRRWRTTIARRAA